MAAEMIGKMGPGTQVDLKTLADSLRGDKAFQKAATEAFMNSPEGKSFFPETKAEAFKTPEGFSNVVGVGPSPVMEAMAAQLEEAQKQTALLEKIAGEAPGVSNDFTKGSPIPTRAGMLVK